MKLKHTCFLCDSILPGQHCPDKEKHEWYFKTSHQNSKKKNGVTNMNYFKLVKNSWVVTIWWCIWGWVDWQCCHLEIWWSMSCISVSLAPDGAVAETHALAQWAKGKYPPISISAHARTDHKAWWEPGNVGHLIASKLIVSGLCWCLRWEHARLACMKENII